MKMNTRAIAAIAAAAMAVSSLGTVVSAKGWEQSDSGTKYVLSSGKNAADGLYIIDGTVYKFDKDGNSIGKYSACTKKDGVRSY